MVRFAANLSMLFTEVPFLERFDRARAVGFARVEFQFPYAFETEAIAEAVRRNELGVELFNLPAGDFAAGERGIANDPRRTAEFEEGVRAALEIAARLGVRKLNCLAGKRLSDVSEEEQRAALKRNLAHAADAAQDAGVLLLVEPLNPFDAPGFVLSTPSQGFALVEEVGHPNLKVQYDLYHAQRTEGNLVHTIAQRIDQIGHLQIADSPGRGEPGSGEIAWPFVFERIDAAGYDGWIGAEYTPSEGNTERSLAWMADYV